MSNYTEIEYTESILDKIDLAEKEYNQNNNKAAEYLILDRMSYRQLLYERNISVITKYHGYVVAVIKTDYEEIIRFI